MEIQRNKDYRLVQIVWVPTAREKRVARLLGLKDVDQLPKWFERQARNFTLRQIAAHISSSGEAVGFQWVGAELAKFGIPTRERRMVPAPKAAAAAGK